MKSLITALMSLFGQKRQTPKAEATYAITDLPAAFQETVSHAIRPAIRLNRDGKGRSHLGGRPSLPADMAWPCDAGEPLAFLGQIALSELPQPLASTLGFPSDGILYFFFDQEQSVWGTEPADKAKWRVFYACSSGRATGAAPAGLKVEYQKANITFSTIGTLPDELDGVAFDDASHETYLELKSQLSGPFPKHLMGGYPDPVQNDDMDMDCEIMSQRISRDRERVSQAEMKQNARDWMLLLQLDTDDDLGMMWGDVGRLYFWIRKADLQARNFENVWMWLQCH